MCNYIHSKVNLQNINEIVFRQKHRQLITKILVLKNAKEYFMKRKEVFQSENSEIQEKNKGGLK